MKIKRQNKKILNGIQIIVKIVCVLSVCLIVTESLHIVCWSTKYTFVHKVPNAGAHCSEMHLTSTEGLDVYNDKIKLDGSS